MACTALVGLLSHYLCLCFPFFPPSVTVPAILPPSCSSPEVRDHQELFYLSPCLDDLPLDRPLTALGICSNVVLSVRPSSIILKLNIPLLSYDYFLSPFSTLYFSLLPFNNYIFYIFILLISLLPLEYELHERVCLFVLISGISSVPRTLFGS